MEADTFTEIIKSLPQSVVYLITFALGYLLLRLWDKTQNRDDLSVSQTILAVSTLRDSMSETRVMLTNFKDVLTEIKSDLRAVQSIASKVPMLEKQIDHLQDKLLGK